MFKFFKHSSNSNSKNEERVTCVYCKESVLKRKAVLNKHNKNACKQCYGLITGILKNICDE